MSPKQERQTATQRQAIRQERLNKERQKRTRLILSVIGIAVLVVGAVYVINRISKPSAQDLVVITPNTRPQADANSMGDPNSPVEIVEFSDFQCPYCKTFADQIEGQIVDAYVKTGKVHFTYRSMGNFVSDNIGQGSTESKDAAMASYCAADQNKFWEYKDALYANWLGEDAGSFTDERLLGIAEQVGLDLAEFRDCYENNTHLDQVQQDYADGRAAGVTGTPSFLINGQLLVGAQPFTTFQQQIEAALQAAGQ